VLPFQLTKFGCDSSDINIFSTAVCTFCTHNVRRSNAVLKGVEQLKILRAKKGQSEQRGKMSKRCLAAIST